MGGTQGSLGLLDLASQLLHGPLILRHVLAMLLLENLHEMLHDTLIKIFSTQVRVSVGRHHLEDAVIDRQQ